VTPRGVLVSWGVLRVSEVEASPAAASVGVIVWFLAGTTAWLMMVLVIRAFVHSGTFGHSPMSMPSDSGRPECSSTAVPARWPPSRGGRAHEAHRNPRAHLDHRASAPLTLLFRLVRGGKAGTCQLSTCFPRQ
jgi:hypothetical protein